MASTIINCSELNIADVKFYAPRASQGGGKSIGTMNKKTNAALRLRLPIMFTYGASDYQGNEKYSCGLQFPDIFSEDCDPKYKECFEQLSAFEAGIKRKVLEFSKDWTGKQLKNEEMVDMMWSPMLRFPKNKETQELEMDRPPTLNVKIPCFEGKWSSEIYNENKEKIFPDEEDPSVTPLNFITKGTHMMAIVQFGGLWVVGGKIGATWKLVQAVVKQQSTTIQGTCLIDMDEGDKKHLEKKADLTKFQEPETESSETSSSSSAPVSTEVADSDDEKETDEQPETEEVDEEPSAVPAPAPVAPAAKKGRAKK